jgi:small-conductance mechanosensitive channel
MPTNIAYSWSDAVLVSFQDMWAGVIGFLPSLVAAILILIVGWLVGAIIGRVVHQVIRSIKLDEALRKAGLEDFLQKGGIRLDSGGFLGGLVKWFFIIVFLVAAFDTVKLTKVNDFLKDVVLYYLPQVIIAVFILMIAVVVADVMQNVVIASARTARLKSANFLGSVTKWSIWVFAVFIALDQLGIAAHFVQMLFTGVVIALSIALGLSFGLGGQEAASRFISKLREEISEKN